MNEAPAVELVLARFAESAWTGVVRPWLEAARGRLGRSVVLVPSLGQAHGLKQRCLGETVPLFGVEFLTPGQARRRRGERAGLERDLQVLVLNALVESRVVPLERDDPARGIWRSLASDLDAALADFEELLRAGFSASDFSRPELRDIFGEFTSWVDRHGYTPSPTGIPPLGHPSRAADLPSAADRVLILGGGPEQGPDFFELAAFAGRCPSVCVVVAEPDDAAGEAWVDLWEAFLGIEWRLVDAPDPESTCAPVANLMRDGTGTAECAEVVIGRSVFDEMDRIAETVDRLLGEGAENVAVLFPGPGAAHARFAGLLEARGIPFADLLGSKGTAPTDFQIQRGLADLYERGCRVEDLLSLWPVLEARGLARAPLGEARAACQDLFDEVQSHSIERQVERLEKASRPGAREVGRVARLLLPGWPATLSMAEAISRFESVRTSLMLSEPPRWHLLREFAARAPEPMPSGALLRALKAFLPEGGVAWASAGRGVFARVTLTTVRRAVGLAWSDAVFVQCNSGIGADRRESSPWLTDDERRTLTSAGRYKLGVATREDRIAADRRIRSSITRDTRRRVVFSASRHGDEDAETALGFDPWLERVLWSKGIVSIRRPEPVEQGPPGWAGRVPGVLPVPNSWLEIWRRRRNPLAVFDVYFLSDPTGAGRPAVLSATQIERGFKDPAHLWFGSVLRVERIDWAPFMRRREKSIGIAVHRLLRAALSDTGSAGAFAPTPVRASAAERLEGELARLRRQWPQDRYWDSFHIDVSWCARELLRQACALAGKPFAAVEVRLPDGATVPVGESERIGVIGKIDLALSDRNGWMGADIEVVDFKTGGDRKLSTRGMAQQGASLQLGVYLKAAESLGARGRVWMLKPNAAPAHLEAEELDKGLDGLARLGDHLRSGIYGALTPDRGEHAHGFEWPLACAPIGEAVLVRKFEATFKQSVVIREAEDV